MRKIIKTIAMIVINSAVITIVYKLGNSKGYDKGRNDGAIAGACAKCVFDGSEDCSDIPDFKGMYS